MADLAIFISVALQKNLSNMDGLRSLKDDLKLFLSTHSRLNDHVVLDLSYGNHKSVPSKVYGMKHLEELNLSGNSIKKITVQFTNHVPALKTLDFSGNKIGSLPDSFATNLSTSLTTLNLAYNLLCFMPVGAIYELRNLRSLNLNYNGLSQVVEGISNLKRLEKLSLEGNSIKTLAADTSKLSELKELNLKKNQLKQLPATLAGMRSLRILDLSHNPFQELPKPLSTLQNLKELDMSHCKITDLTVSVLSSLENASILNFGHNQLFHVPKELAELDKVKTIIMDGNETGVAWPSIVCQMQNLQVDLSAVATSQKLHVNIVQPLRDSSFLLQEARVRKSPRLHKDQDVSFANLKLYSPAAYQPIAPPRNHTATGKGQKRMAR